MDNHLIITCEHAGNQVPAEYRHLFENREEVLNTHRGVDIGALELTNAISTVMKTDPYIQKVTRLLVDLNRSLNNPSAFSEFSRQAELEDRERMVENYYLPYRREVEERIHRMGEEGATVIHLSVHTFTPELEGVERNADIGFLYDPRRKAEKKLCHAWREELEKRLPELRCRMNYPYRGTMDGFSTSLRKEFGEDRYVGIELEVNQKFPQLEGEPGWETVQKQIALSLQQVVDEGSWHSC